MLNGINIKDLLSLLYTRKPWERPLWSQTSFDPPLGLLPFFIRNVLFVLTRVGEVLRLFWRMTD